MDPVSAALTQNLRRIFVATLVKRVERRDTSFCGENGISPLGREWTSNETVFVMMPCPRSQHLQMKFNKKRLSPRAENPQHSQHHSATNMLKNFSSQHDSVFCDS